MIPCPECQHTMSSVLDTRPNQRGEYVKRRRKCDSCGERYTTHEILASRRKLSEKGGNDTLLVIAELKKLLKKLGG